MKKAILFDLDGTLLNTLDDLADSANHVLESHGWPTHERDAYKLFVGSGAANLIKRIIPENEVKDDEIEELAQEFIARYNNAHILDKTRPYDGIIDMIALLKNRGVNLAVTSNKPDAQTRYLITEIFGEGTFSHVAGSTKGLPVKPDPTIAITAMQALSATPDECAFCGDSGVDMQTAKNARCCAIGVTWGFRSREELVANGADVIIDSPDELIGIIKQS
ncbi:phosphoglycolate phosphatase [Synergistales bacterium]|nr:phosphoglycolate phosphatase [Synergistales bacterium]